MKLFSISAAIAEGWYTPPPSPMFAVCQSGNIDTQYRSRHTNPYGEKRHNEPSLFM